MGKPLYVTKMKLLQLERLLRHRAHHWNEIYLDARNPKERWIACGYALALKHIGEEVCRLKESAGEKAPPNPW